MLHTRYLRLVGYACTALTLCIGACAWAQPSDAPIAKGIVYHDYNLNGVNDPSEPGIPHVAVSNGTDVTLTNASGQYELPAPDPCIIFIIKPTGWMTPLNKHNMPVFHYIHNSSGSPQLKYPGVSPTGPLPESINFALYPQEEPDAFKVVLFGDTQVRDEKEIFYLERDIISELRGTCAKFCISLGDLGFDNLTVFEPLCEANGTMGIPVYSVLGNHDNDYTAENNSIADDPFERVFGPSTYAFEYAQAVFIVLDDVLTEQTKYHAELTDAQLRFIGNYLANVSRDKLIIFSMHIPIMEINNKDKLFEILAPFPHTFSVSAHWHSQAHFFLTAAEGWKRPEPHHHLVHVTTCGSWWRGFLDEENIPHTIMSDGGPNGYSFLNINGNTYSVDYKAARKPAEYQLRIELPSAITKDNLTSTEVVVNVFAGSSRSTVQMRVGLDSGWLPMTQTRRPDPAFVQLKAREDWLVGILTANIPENERESFRIEKAPGALDFYGGGLPRIAETSHIWVSTLPAELTPGVHVLYVRTTDMFGNQFESSRMFRVQE